MKWFKHYKGASDSEFIQTLEERHGLLRYAHWMKFLELLCSKYEDTPVISLTRKEIEKKLNIKPSSVDLVIASFEQADLKKVVVQRLPNDPLFFDEKLVILFNAPIIEDLKGKDFKKSRASREQDSLREREKNKDPEQEKELEDFRQSLVQSKSKNISAVSPTQVVDLFNKKLAGVGNFKTTPGHFLPGPILQDFAKLVEHESFQKISTWETLFDEVAKSTFFRTKFTPTLAWLFKSENAFKVLAGQYQDMKTEEPEKGFENKMDAWATSEANS